MFLLKFATNKNIHFSISKTFVPLNHVLMVVYAHKVHLHMIVDVRIRFEENNANHQHQFIVSVKILCH